MKHGIVCTINRNIEDGKMIAVISDGASILGHTDITTLKLREVADERQARDWFKRMRKERPWEL